MKGDFTRITYNERNHYSLVLMQQGRVQVDADWNEQAIIQWLNLQKLAEDLIGEHGGPNDGFKIEPRLEGDSEVTSDFMIKRGRYYVDGVMCENSYPCPFTKQDNYPVPEGEGIQGQGIYLVYLHVWWRHITTVEDDYIREVALKGPDTATRVKTVWQVKVKALTEASPFADEIKGNYGFFKNLLGDDIKRSSARLMARVVSTLEAEEPCVISPESRYRGAENQFYRVEIHRSGQGYKENANIQQDEIATFKWSRENGSVVFPIRKLNGDSVTLQHLGRDSRFGLKEGDWVEVVDDVYELQGRTEDLFQVVAVDPVEMKVTLSGSPLYGRDLSRNPLLRRWDHSGDQACGGTVMIKEEEWVELEDGVHVYFSSPSSDEGEMSSYNSRDWWWIAARTATGDVEWPRDENGELVMQRPLDSGHRYAPLALVEFDASGNIVESNIGTKMISDLRRMFIRLWK